MGSAAGTGPVESRAGRYKGHSVTYQLEHVLCNKSGCRRLHGPYWYAYWKEGGRVRKRYIGRTFQTVSQKDRRRSVPETDE